MSRNKKDFNYEKANLIHNNKYDYSKVIYIGSKDKVEIICPKHGSFWQTPDDHIRKGNGCPKCAIENRKKSRTYKTDKGETITKEEFIKKINELYGNKYEFPELKDEFSYRRKIKIICPIHGEFYETPYSLLFKNKDCVKCKKEKFDTKHFIENAIKVHGNKYDYSKVNYIDNLTPVCIICPEHGEFWLKPNLHISSHCGCPKCNRSHGEEQIAKYFQNKKDFDITEQKLMSNPYNDSYIFVDFYVKFNNKEYIIEFNGEQHYKYIPRFHVNGIKDFQKQQLRDENLRKICLENNITLIEISYKQIKIISEILDKYFIK